MGTHLLQREITIFSHTTALYIDAVSQFPDCVRAECPLLHFLRANFACLAKVVSILGMLPLTALLQDLLLAGMWQHEDHPSPQPSH